MNRFYFKMRVFFQHILIRNLFPLLTSKLFGANKERILNEPGMNLADSQLERIILYQIPGIAG